MLAGKNGALGVGQHERLPALIDQVPVAGS